MIGSGSLIAAILILVFLGLNILSAVLEAVVFAVGVLLWMIERPNDPTTSGLVRKIYSHAGQVRIRQEGPKVETDDVDAGGDVDIVQRNKS